MIVIGIETKEGVFNGNSWKKTYIYCAEEINPEKGEGQRTEYFKCRPDVASNVELGDSVKVYFDKYNNVDFIQVL